MNLALFDLDNTLIAGDSEVEWPRFMCRRGLLSPSHLAQCDAYYDQYVAGTLDLQVALHYQLAHLADFTRARLDALHADYMAECILPIILLKARALLAHHRAQGDVMMVITSSDRFLTEPIARELGVEHLIAIELEQDAHGRFTGRSEGVLSFQEGKITRLHAWLAERRERLEDYDKVFFYSDSKNDLPLLSSVSDPVAVDPDAVLYAHAKAHGWPIISLRD